MNLTDRLAHRRPFYGWYIVATVFVVGMVRVGFTGTFFGMFLKPMALEFDWSRTQVTGAVTVGTLVAGAVSFLVGRAVDRYGARGIVVGGGFLLGASFLGLSLVRGLLTFYLIYVLGRAIMQSALGDSLMATVVSKWFVRRRGRAIAAASIGGSLGTVILAPVTQAIIDGPGWRMAWVLHSLLVWALLLAPAFLLVRRTPEDLGLLPDGQPAPSVPGAPLPAGGATAEPTGDGPEDEASLTLRQALGTPALWLLSIMVGVASIASTGVTFHLIPHLTDVGISPPVAASAISVYSVTQIGATFLSGFVVERTGAKKGLLATFLLLAFGVFLVSRMEAVAGVYLAAGIYGLGFGAYGTLVQVLWADFFGRRQLSSIRGLSLVFQLAGNASGSLFSARVFDLTGSYRGAFNAILGMELLLFLLLLLTPRPRLGGRSGAVP